MPIQKCQNKGKPGYRWGKRGKCYTYTRGNARSKKIALNKVRKQALAIGEL